MPPCAASDVVLTTYGMVARSAALRSSEPGGLVVLDEAQAIKNAGAQQSRAVKQLIAPARIVLTGTPIENRLSDLWSLFDFLNPGAARRRARRSPAHGQAPRAGAGAGGAMRRFAGWCSPTSSDA